MDSFIALLDLLLKYNIKIPLWLLIIFIILFICAIFFKKYIENLCDSFFHNFGILKVDFIMKDIYFLKYFGCFPSDIKKVKKNDNPNSVFFLVKVKFYNNSEKEKTIFNFDVYLQDGDKLIKPNNICFSLDENRNNINSFKINKSLPIILYCYPNFNIIDIINIRKNNKLLFSYNIENKTKIIKTNITTYVTDDGEFSLF